jgi:hypothetical protein
MKDLHFQDELDENLQKGLNVLPLAERPPEAAATGRAAFMNQVESLRTSVSPELKRRHTGWIANIKAGFQTRKEKTPMWTAIVTIITVLTLALGGGGGTVAAAQSAMPDQALYSVKTWTENLRYELAGTNQNRLELALNFAERRMEEIKTMLQAGNLPDQSVSARYQAQIETALRLASGMAGEDGTQALQQIQQQLLIQVQTLSQLHMEDAGLEGVLLQTREMLQTRLQWVEQGLDDPTMLRKQIQNQQGQQDGTGDGNPWEELTQPTTCDPTIGSNNCLTCTPAQDGSNSQNPWTSETPIPGSGYGPGPGTCDGVTCTPAEDGSNSQNPWTSETPIPGSGYGSGNGDSQTNTPMPSETPFPTTTMQGSGSGSGGPSSTQGSGSGSGGSTRP